MKDLKSIKLTQLDQVQLEERKMSYLVGGTGGTCNCGCYYANTGGSSSADNSSANSAITPVVCGCILVELPSGASSDNTADNHALGI